MITMDFFLLFIILYCLLTIFLILDHISPFCQVADTHVFGSVSYSTL